MSAIAGVCYWDGRPIGDDSLSIMASHSHAAGPDGGGTVAPIPGLAMQAHVLHFDSLSKVERQPHAFGNGSVLTWDGRLDNRDDLLVSLHRDLGHDITDAALVAGAYARWGLDCVPRLIGDWSFAIWDAPNRRIVLARDYMGNRPLYYLELPGGLAWASNLDALVDCFDLYRYPDESYIAGKLTYGVPPEITPFRGVRALRAGHLLCASQRAGVEVRRYWTFQPSRIRYRDPREYTDHLRVLLTEAVAVRLRASRRVWAHLSGGYDSSTIVCLANTQIQRRRVEAPALQPISMVVPGSPESDESRFIEAVESWCGLVSRRSGLIDELQPFSKLLTYRRPFICAADDVFEAPMIPAGDHILLSGEMGDLTMLRGSNEFIALLEPLHEARPLTFLKMSFGRARRRRRPLLRLLARLMAMAYVPEWDLALALRQQRALQARELGVSPRDSAALFGVTPALLAKAARDVWQSPSLADFPIVKRFLVQALYKTMDSDLTSTPDWLPQIWKSFPFVHRPLVEFVVGIPQLALCDPLQTRAGMRRALMDVLPPPVLDRQSKGEPQAALARLAINSTPEVLTSRVPIDPSTEWHIVAKGYVSSASLDKHLNLLSSSRPLPSGFLTACLQLEAWLRTMDRTMRRTERAHSATTEAVRVTPVAAATS